MIESWNSPANNSPPVLEPLGRTDQTLPATSLAQPSDSRVPSPILLDGSNPFTIEPTSTTNGDLQPRRELHLVVFKQPSVPELELIDAPEAPIEKPLTADEKETVKYLQSQLIAIYPLAFEKSQGMTAEQKDAQVKDDIEALKKEIEQQRFGPTTRKFYAAMVKWLEQAAVPGAVKELSRLALPLPAGSPMSLPRNEQGRLAGQEYYQALVMADRLRPNFKIDTTHPPSFDVLDTIDDTMKWLRTADDSARIARQDRQDQLLERQIKQIITNPDQQKAWLDRRGSMPNEWRAAAIEAIDLSTRVKNYVEAMDSLHRAGKRFPIKLPPGCNVTRDSEGRLTHVSLDLPKDLRLGHAENNRKMDTMRRWLHDHGNQIDQAVKEMIKLEENPDRLLFWGEIEMPHGLAKTDANGNIIDFVDPKKADGTEKEFNLAQMRFDVDEKVDQNGKRKIVVSNSVQYEKAHWYNYLNIGASDVGNKVNVESREYDPDDWVAVRSGRDVELVQAKNLAFWKLTRQTFHYGEKVLIATLDGAMLVSGLAEVSAAIKAAQAGKLVVSQAVKQAMKGGLRAAVGMSGIVNNAYFKETEYGQKIQTARGMYFVGDAAFGLGQSGWRLANKLRGVTSTGTTAAEIVNTQIQASRWARTYKYAERAAKLTEVPFAFIIFNDIGGQVDHLRNLGRTNPIHAAIRQAIEGRGEQKPKENETSPTNPIEKSTREIKRYKALLKGSSNEAAVTSILDRAEQLSGKPAEDPERQRFLQEMMSHFMPDGERIKALELAGTFYADRNKRYIGHAERCDRSVQTAAAVAILSLTSAADGKLPDSLMQRTVQVPQYEREEQTFNPQSDSTSTGIRTVPERTERQELRMEDIVSFLRRELENPKPESRLVASGDLALQVGCANGIEVAGALQDAILNPKTSEYEKAQAVIRLGAVIDALKVQESQPLDPSQQFKEDAKRVGLSSKAIEDFLERLARTGGSSAVRSIASLMVHANTEGTTEDRQNILRQYSLRLSELPSNTNEISKFAVDTLSRLMKDDRTNARQRLNAAIALSYLSGENRIPETSPELRLETLSVMASCVDSKDVALATQALKSLIPDGLKELDAQRPNASNSIRNGAIQIIRDTQEQIRAAKLDQNGEKERVAFVELVGGLIKDGQPLQRTQIDTLLQDFVNPGSNGYADISADLRRASVRVLAESGSRAALPVLRERLLGSKEKGIEPDKNAGVRQAALKALERMRDPQLRQTVLELINKETDPAVSATLKEIQFTQVRLEPTSEEYRDAFERTASALMRDPFEGWSGLKQEIERHKTYMPENERHLAMQHFVRDWRDRQYWMLNSTEYHRFRRDEGDRVAHAVYSGVNGFFDWMTSSEKTIRDAENAVRNDKHDSIKKRRDAQLQDLIDCANRPNVNGMKAKMALLDILVNGGQPFSSEESEWAQREVSKALKDLCEPGVENRDYVAWTIQTGLTTGPAMDKQARENLLEGLKKLAKPDSKNRVAITREAASITVARALELENNLRAPYQADPNLQIKFIESLGEFRHHRAFPVLDAIAKERANTPVGFKAQQAMTDLRDSVLLVWEDTVPDQVATLATRAKNLESALKKDSTNSDALVEAIFTATKGTTIQTDDPRLTLLQLALNDSNEKVQLAAATAIARMSPPQTIDLTKMREVLNRLAANGSRSAYKQEAAVILNQFR